MKNIYSSLVTLVVFVVLAPLAIADPGTTWENIFPAPSRFQVLREFHDEAVFDRETGRVWELSPRPRNLNWFDALELCYALEVGGRNRRKGWRLPTIEELASLVDTSNLQGSLSLPAGHPFVNVQSAGFYWSATTLARNNNIAYGVMFGDGRLFRVRKDGQGRDDNFVWCVRGGQGVDGGQPATGLPPGTP